MFETLRRVLCGARADPADVDDESERTSLKPYEKLIRHWRDNATGTVPTGMHEGEVAGLEMRYRVKFPSDFRDYLIHCCPAKEMASYDDYTSWYELDRLKNIPEVYGQVDDPVIARDASEYIVFADYLVGCTYWAIACGDTQNRGRIVLLYERPRFVADSFSQFVDVYIDDIHPLAVTSEPG